MGVEMMAEESQDVSVVLSQEQPPVLSQPAHQPSEVKLDKATVREATMKAAEQGVDPFSMTIGDLNQGQPAVPQKPVQAEPPADVPDKFKKPTGEVDVEKLKASTERLDEAIEKKEQALQKSVDDYVKAYREKEVKFNNLPNADKLKVSPPPVPLPTAPMDPNVVRARIEQDFERDKIGTLSDIVDILVSQRLAKEIAPLKEDFEQVHLERQDRQLRSNLQALAERDPRILHPKVFAAITAKLDASPELWKLQNPHKAAWLDVKDELRLGEPSQASAQPSRPLSPILGGGTPPPAPSSSDGTLSVDTLLQAASRLGRDPRDVKYDPNQAKNMRASAKELFDKLDRQARR